MPGVDWRLQGVSYGSCNCSYGCPCQFEADPTHGYCRGFEVSRIDQGHFGEVRLDGLAFVLLYAWPGPVYRGQGTKQAIIDERAEARQREALLKIVNGEETEPGATPWWIFHSTMSEVREPLFRPIAVDIDIAARRARLRVPGIIDSAGQPIRSPVTGEEHRVRIDLPNGVEFRLAEIGSGTTTTAPSIIDLTSANTYAQFIPFHQTPRGLVT